jgi:hypothetical protein
MASSAFADSRWIARGAERTSLTQFLLWLAPWALVLAVGAYAAGLCLYYGLNQTNMDNRFAFGLWIFLDLAIIALGAGAFFTGFLVYIPKRAELQPSGRSGAKHKTVNLDQLFPDICAIVVRGDQRDAAACQMLRGFPG